MRLLSILTLLISLAGCAAQSPVIQKRAFAGPEVGASSAIVARSRSSSVTAKAMRVGPADGEAWLLHVTIDRRDGRTPDVVAVYALGALMPYVRLSSEGAREDGYIPMNRAIFERLSETGFRIDLMDSDNRMHSIVVPGRAFRQVASLG